MRQQQISRLLCSPSLPCIEDDPNNLINDYWMHQGRHVCGLCQMLLVLWMVG